MAPQQPFDYDEWDDDDMVVPSAHIITTAPLSKDCDCELGEAQSSYAALSSTLITTPRKERPPSILRRPLSSRQQEEGPLSSSLPSHWPTASAAATITKRQRVHFADGPRRIISSSPPSVVTAIYYRPRTPISDVSSLYYSALDVKNFKREFRALLRSQKLARQRLQHDSDERMSSTDTNRDTTTVQHRDNSFWRSKVSRWSAQTSATSATVLSVEKDDRESNQDITDSDDIIDSVPPPDHEGGGIFSSVFDVAREAVSLFGTSSSYYQKERTPQQIQHHHLVDTLYLF
jgi:hypothetical protein